MKSLRKRWIGEGGAVALRQLQRMLLKRDPVGQERVGAALGRMVYRVSKKRYERALWNLALALPELSEAERIRIARACAEHFGIVFADSLTLGKRSREHLLESVSVTGVEVVEEALSLGKGALLVTGHLGSWDRMAAWASAQGYKVRPVARDADAPGMTKLLNENRTALGLDVIPRGDAARPILETLRAGGLVAILADQNSRECFIPFFGHPAGTVLGPGVLAERTGAPVIAAACFRVGPAQYEGTFGPILRAEEGYSVRGEGMMRAYHAWLEGAIRSHPEQWLWIHDRWRNARKAGLLK